MEGRQRVITPAKFDIKFVTDVQTGEPRIWSEGSGANAILKAEVNEKETFGVLFDLLGKYLVKTTNMELSRGIPESFRVVVECTVTGGTFKGQDINPQLEMTRVIKDGDSIQVTLDTMTTTTMTVGCCVIA
jgi:hypothetical protein